MDAQGFVKPIPTVEGDTGSFAEVLGGARTVVGRTVLTV